MDDSAAVAAAIVMDEYMKQLTEELTKARDDDMDGRGSASSASTSASVNVTKTEADAICPLNQQAVSAFSRSVLTGFNWSRYCHQDTAQLTGQPTAALLDQLVRQVYRGLVASRDHRAPAMTTEKTAEVKGWIRSVVASHPGWVEQTAAGEENPPATVEIHDGEKEDGNPRALPAGVSARLAVRPSLLLGTPTYSLSVQGTSVSGTHEVSVQINDIASKAQANEHLDTIAGVLDKYRAKAACDQVERPEPPYEPWKLVHAHLTPLFRKSKKKKRRRRREKSARKSTSSLTKRSDDGLLEGPLSEKERFMLLPARRRERIERARMGQEDTRLPDGNLDALEPWWQELQESRLMIQEDWRWETKPQPDEDDAAYDGWAAERAKKRAERRARDAAARDAYEAAEHAKSSAAYSAIRAAYHAKRLAARRERRAAARAAAGLPPGRVRDRAELDAVSAALDAAHPERVIARAERAASVAKEALLAAERATAEYCAVRDATLQDAALTTSATKLAELEATRAAAYRTKRAADQRARRTAVIAASTAAAAGLPPPPNPIEVRIIPRTSRKEAPSSPKPIPEWQLKAADEMWGFVREQVNQSLARKTANETEADAAASTAATRASRNLRRRRTTVRSRVEVAGPSRRPSRQLPLRTTRSATAAAVGRPVSPRRLVPRSRKQSTASSFSADDDSSSSSDDDSESDWNGSQATEDDRAARPLRTQSRPESSVDVSPDHTGEQHAAAGLDPHSPVAGGSSQSLQQPDSPRREQSTAAAIEGRSPKRPATPSTTPPSSAKRRRTKQVRRAIRDEQSPTMATGVRSPRRRLPALDAAPPSLTAPALPAAGGSDPQPILLASDQRDERSSPGGATEARSPLRSAARTTPPSSAERPAGQPTGPKPGKRRRTKQVRRAAASGPGEKKRRTL